MLGFLFRGLTAEPAVAARLFDTLTAEARQPAWYRAAAVPDTFNGRFAVLATVTALTLVRLEAEGEAGSPLSVALTERFIEVMEAEHRQLGINDPTLGKTVRKLVAMLARRTDLWRTVSLSGDGRREAVRTSLYNRDNVSPDVLDVATEQIEELMGRLQAATPEELEQGKLA